LYEQVHRASERREPPDDEYGDRAACERLIARIGEARAALDKRTGILVEIRKRADAFNQLARYRGSGDVLPIAETIAAGGPITTRVIGEDTWEIRRVLLG